MRQTKQKSNSMTLLLAIFLIIIGNMIIFPYIIANESEVVFIPGDDDGDNSNSGRCAIQQKVISAAGYFLLSQSDFLLFLNKIEISGTTGTVEPELPLILEKACLNMESAVNEYAELVTSADNTAYETGILYALSTFDYDALAMEKKVNREIFQQVQSFLKNGDVKGLYHQLKANASQLLQDLQRLRGAIDPGLFPNIGDLWAIGQTYSETLLFGNYTAAIFYRITGKD